MAHPLLSTKVIIFLVLIFLICVQALGKRMPGISSCTLPVLDRFQGYVPKILHPFHKVCRCRCDRSQIRAGQIVCHQPDLNQSDHCSYSISYKKLNLRLYPPLVSLQLIEYFVKNIISICHVQQIPLLSTSPSSSECF